MPYIRIYKCFKYDLVEDQNSSVGIATRYGLDSPGIESRWGRDFSASFQTVPGAHQSSYTMGTGSFLGGKAAGEWRWPPTPSSAGIKERIELYIYSTSEPSWSVIGWNLPLLSGYIFHVLVTLRNKRGMTMDTSSSVRYKNCFRRKWFVCLCFRQAADTSQLSVRGPNGICWPVKNNSPARQHSKWSQSLSKDFGIHTIQSKPLSLVETNVCFFAL